jgi:hypothetical protein
MSLGAHFDLITPFQMLDRRSMTVAGGADGNILDPDNARPLIDGEWLQPDGLGAMVRGGTGHATNDEPATVPQYVYVAERGRYETQGLGKGPFLWIGDFEADTLVWAGAPGTTSENPPTTVGQPLEVRNVVFTGGIIRRGFALCQSGSFVVGFVTRLPANNANRLRFSTKGAGGILA